MRTNGHREWDSLLFSDQRGGPMAAANIDVETREWLDRLEIQDLIHRYSDGVTRADWQQCEAVFTPDATWESSASSGHSVRRSRIPYGDPKGDIFIRSSDPDGALLGNHDDRRSSRPVDNDYP
jgi:SnoaL-like domain